MSLFVCGVTVAPLFRSTAWWVRVCDFPRVQIAGLGTGLLLAAFGKRRMSQAEKVLAAGVSASVLIQGLHMLKYTRLVRAQTLRSPNPVPASTISLLTANIRMKNRQSLKLLQLVERYAPDILLVLEPDQWWVDQMAPIESHYKWKVKVPQDNTYGLALYSSIEMLNCHERRLVQKDVPSVRALMRLDNGQKFWFYAVHPRPPVRGNLEGDLEFTGAASRDAELIRVALEIAELREPVLVAGDFNDVAWSHTTRRFQRLGRLLDPRVGRGLYNSYHAQHAWFRFPVDHLFHSKEFSLVHFGRGPEIGSDHFPILATLALGAPPEQQAPPRKPDDVQEAVETLNYGFSNR